MSARSEENMDFSQPKAVPEGGAPCLMIGYDVESDRPDTTLTFLERAARAHRELGVPCTLYMVGRILEDGRVRDALASLAQDPLFDIQQHTYSHLRLKTVAMDDGQKVQVFEGGTPERIDEDIRRANRAIRDALGVTCTGLTGPWGYYRGLMDRPDLLGILRANGIRFCRTFARNEFDFQPVPYSLQPFWYAPQGYPEILEFPVQGWQDCYLREKLGYEDTDGYVRAIVEQMDEVMAHGTGWSYCQHDWTSIAHDEDMRMVRGIVAAARERGIGILTNRDYLETVSA
jgi:peptidoglycan/xylan/chitin deacetylase (PgdA/CDA1 family)